MLSAQGAGSPETPLLSERDVEQSLRLDREHRARRRAYLESPGAREGRSRSRGQYRHRRLRDLRSLMRDRFATLGASPTEALRLPDPKDIREYVNDHLARVDRPGPAKDALAASVLPLRMRDKSGQKRPLDLDLIERDGRFQTKNGPAKVAFPKRLSDGIAIAGGQREIHPDAGPGASPAQGELVDGRDRRRHRPAHGAHPHGLGDLHRAALGERAHGAALRLDLPEGAELRQAAEGAKIAGHGRRAPRLRPRLPDPRRPPGDRPLCLAL